MTNKGVNFQLPPGGQFSAAVDRSFIAATTASGVRPRRLKTPRPPTARRCVSYILPEFSNPSHGSALILCNPRTREGPLSAPMDQVPAPPRRGQSQRTKWHDRSQCISHGCPSAVISTKSHSTTLGSSAMRSNSSVAITAKCRTPQPAALPRRVSNRRARRLLQVAKHAPLYPGHTRG
jgi:hypothetical protein